MLGRGRDSCASTAGQADRRRASGRSWEASALRGSSTDRSGPPQGQEKTPRVAVSGSGATTTGGTATGGSRRDRQVHPSRQMPQVTAGPRAYRQKEQNCRESPTGRRHFAGEQHFASGRDLASDRCLRSLQRSARLQHGLCLRLDRPFRAFREGKPRASTL